MLSQFELVLKVNNEIKQAHLPFYSNNRFPFYLSLPWDTCVIV
jgi:hypothetical protein